MYNFQLPTQKGLDLFPNVMALPCIVRFVNVGDNALGEQLKPRLMGYIQQFFMQCQQQYALSPVAFLKLKRNLPGLAFMSYVNNSGMARIDVEIAPELLESKQPQLSFIFIEVPGVYADFFSEVAVRFGSPPAVGSYMNWVTDDVYDAIAVSNEAQRVASTNYTETVGLPDARFPTATWKEVYCINLHKYFEFTGRDDLVADFYLYHSGWPAYVVEDVTLVYTKHTYYYTGPAQYWSTGTQTVFWAPFSITSSEYLTYTSQGIYPRRYIELYQQVGDPVPTSPWLDAIPSEFWDSYVTEYTNRGDGTPSTEGAEVFCRMRFFAGPPLPSTWVESTGPSRLDLDVLYPIVSGGTHIPVKDITLEPFVSTVTGNSDFQWVSMNTANWRDVDLYTIKDELMLTESYNWSVGWPTQLGAVPGFQ